jgi:myo-inositol-1(or 4)-monophosphatase
MTGGSDDVDEMRNLAVEAAQMAGAELLRRFGNIEGLDTKTSATDPVSDADRASEAILQREILSSRPDDGLISEEGASRECRSGLTWVVDPLDGTVNYLYGLDMWSVSVAVEDAQGPLVGVVYEPVADRTYHAVRGRGAWLDDTRLQVNEPVPMAQALVATGFSYLPDRRAQSGRLIGELLPEIRDIRRIGSGALDLGYVASGRVDAYLEEDIKHWDWAAGVLLVMEAGGNVSPVSRTSATTGILAAGPSLHRDLLTITEDRRQRTT